MSQKQGISFGQAYNTFTQRGQPQQQQPGAILPISIQQQRATGQAAQAAFDPRNSGDVNKQLAVFGQLLTGTNQVLTLFGRTLQQLQSSANVNNSGQANGGVNTNGIQQFTTAFNNFLGQLQQLQIPEQINISAQHTVDVRILGGDVFAQLEPGIREMIINETASQIRRFGLDNFDNIA